MAKRMQEQEGDNRIVAKSKPTTMNLAFFLCFDKFFDCEQSDCFKKPGDTQSTLSNRLVKYRETRRERSQSRRSVEFWRKAKRCISGRKYRETCRDRRRPGTPEPSWRLGKYKETCRPRISRNSRKLRWLGNRRQWRRLATQSPFCNKVRSAHGEGLLDGETKDMVAVRRIKWKTSMWTQRYGVYLWLSLLKLQFIFGKFTEKMCDLPRINPRNLGDSHFKWLRGWSRIRQKLLDWSRLTYSSHWRWKQTCSSWAVFRASSTLDRGMFTNSLVHTDDNTEPRWFCPHAWTLSICTVHNFGTFATVKGVSENSLLCTRNEWYVLWHKV